MGNESKKLQLSTAIKLGGAFIGTCIGSGFATGSECLSFFIAYGIKGAVGALHHHPHTQITYVVSGAFEFTVDGVTRTVHKGDTILKEDGVEHGCVCTEAGILLDIFTPMREDFVK